MLDTYCGPARNAFMASRRFCHANFCCFSPSPGLGSSLARCLTSTSLREREDREGRERVDLSRVMVYDKPRG